MFEFYNDKFKDHAPDFNLLYMETKSSFVTREAPKIVVEKNVL